MPALYDPGADSPLLTGPAAKLKTDTEARDAYARVAERLLGLTEPVFTDPFDVQDAKDAVAIQIVHLLTAGASAFIAQSESRGAISTTYRADVTISPVAAMLAAAVLRRNGRRVTVSGLDPADWATVRSLRSSPLDGTLDVTELMIQP